jgi:hypothetical protein
MHSNNKNIYTYYSVYDVFVEYPSDTFIVTILEEEMIWMSQDVGKLRCRIAQVPLYTGMLCIMFKISIFYNNAVR